MDDTKRFDIESCEVKDNGEIVCEEIDTPEMKDISVVKKNPSPDLSGTIPKKSERPPENIELT